MPFHSLPCSRRVFLRQTVAGALGVLTVRYLQAAGAVQNGHWALLSDPHIAADPAAIRNGMNMTDHLRTVIGQVQQIQSDLEGVMVNGDCAYDLGLPEDYAGFLGLMRPLAAPVPLHFTLGNHDERENFRDALKGNSALAAPLEGKCVSVLETPLANWFLLDSLDVTKQSPGRLGELQLGWLAKALEARKDRPALVMVHHNPVSFEEGREAALLDANELLALLTPRRQVKAVFFGHTHTWRQAEREGLHLINLPAIGYPFQENEAIGWVECHLAGDGMKVDFHPLGDVRPAVAGPLDLHWRA